MYTASVFSETHHCDHCGTPSNGVSILGQAAEQPDTMQQDELVGLFSQKLNFSNPTPPPDKPYSTPPPEIRPEAPEPQPAVYSSQHYVPNRHVVPVRFFTPPQTTPEPQPQPLTDEEMLDILSRNSIDPSTLFPSQVALLRNADLDQRLRLLELWRISPPNLGHYDLAKEQATWLTTTLQQEEQMAKLRYERQMTERTLSPAPAQELERPSSATESGRNRTSVHAHAEPYMMTGYEMLAQREYEQSNSVPLKETTRYNQATDPVFRNSSGSWDKGVVDMENRYGAYEQMRDGGSVPNAVALNGLDEDMAM